MNTGTPNNEAQEVINREIVGAIEECRTMKYFIHGKGGSGKTTLAKKIMAYTRSKSLVALGCASTGLAATIYDNFYTTHTLSCFPVDEEEDISLTSASCLVKTKPIPLI